MNMEEFGKSILCLRQNANMTQEELALRMGVTPHEPVIIRLSQEKPMNQGVALI